MRTDRRESGFTIIEVMVAAMLLVIGVLGSVTLIDAANGVTTNTRAREGATNLAREIVEVARSLPYDDLTTANLQTSLQEQPGLDDSTPATTAWTIERRGNGSTTGAILYTVEVYACVMDDAKDSVRTSDDTTYCNGSAPSSATGTDANPDDFRRVEVDVKWSRPGRPAASCRGANGANAGTGASCVQQSTLVPNPSGGLGPNVRASTIKVFACTGSNASSCPTTAALQSSCSCQIQGSRRVEPGETGVYVTFSTNQAGDSAAWSADNTEQSSGSASTTDTTGKNWGFTWAFPGTLVDGTYTVTIQANLLGADGTPGVASVPVNLNLPAAPDVSAANPAAYGFNTRIPPGTAEFQWGPGNAAFDTNSYQVFRVNNPGSTSAPTNMTTNPNSGGNTNQPVTTCTAALLTQASRSCYDGNIPALTGVYNYFVMALDTPWSTVTNTNFNCTLSPASLGSITVSPTISFWGSNRPGCPSAMLPVDIDAGLVNGSVLNKPVFTANLSVSGTGIPRLTWDAGATDPNGDGIAFFRIYRSTSTPTPVPNSARYANTNANTDRSFDDSSPLTVATSYWVTAVDNKLQESDAIGPVTWVP